MFHNKREIDDLSFKKERTLVFLFLYYAIHNWEEEDEDLYFFYFH